MPDIPNNVPQVTLDIHREIEQEKDRLISYIQKAYKARIKWVKQGKIDQAISSEIGACLSSGRMDLVENLMSRKARLESLANLAEQIEYQQRFGQDEVVLPIEEPLPVSKDVEDSTQKQ